jgi:teichuronic acid biosynthesis glycosyltransferase TuaG
MQNNEPLISIIIPVFNAQKYIEETILSVIGQTYSNWELIVVDDCSTDHSVNIIQDIILLDIRIRLIKSEVGSGGPARPRNIGIESSTGKYIAFLDNDDAWLPDKLEKQVSLMQSKGYAMCYGSVSVVNENGKEIRKNIVKNKSGNVFAVLLRHYEISMPTVIVEKDFLINNKLSFNTNMSYCPDHNLFMTIASKVDVGVITDVVAKYRVVSNSLSKKTIDLAPQEYRLTLDEISKDSPTLRKQLSNDFDCAYDKAKYYEIVADIYNNHNKQARYKLKTIVTSKIEYFLLYLLLFMPISNKLILKLLKR